MDQASKPWIEEAPRLFDWLREVQSQIPRSSGGDLILAIDLQGVGVAPQLYNEGLTSSFEMISHAIVMLPEYFPILLSYFLTLCIESCPSWAIIEEFFGGTLCYILHSS